MSDDTFVAVTVIVGAIGAMVIGSLLIWIIAMPFEAMQAAQP